MNLPPTTRTHLRVEHDVQERVGEGGHLGADERDDGGGRVEEVALAGEDEDGAHGVRGPHAHEADRHGHHHACDAQLLLGHGRLERGELNLSGVL